VYRLIAAESQNKIQFSALKLSLFPLGLEIKNVENFFIRSENLVSFSAVTVTMPITSLFSKKKTINIVIEKPIFALTDSLLKIKPGAGGSFSAFTVKHAGIRHGEIKFKGQDITMQLLDFNLQSGPWADGLAFKLTSPHLKIILPFNGQPLALEGNLNGDFRRQGSTWKINRLLWQTRDIVFNLNGRILKDGSFYLNTSAQGDPENILRPMLKELAVKGLAYANAKISKNVKNKIQIKADFTSPYLMLRENFCSGLAGNLSWNNLSRDLNLETAFDTPLSRSRVQVASKNGETDIIVHDIPFIHDGI